jgi:hypothetical protein
MDEQDLQDNNQRSSFSVSVGFGRPAYADPNFRKRKILSILFIPVQ